MSAARSMISTIGSRRTRSAGVGIRDDSGGGIYYSFSSMPPRTPIGNPQRQHVDGRGLTAIAIQRNELLECGNRSAALGAEALHLVHEVLAVPEHEVQSGPLRVMV